MPNPLNHFLVPVLVAATLVCGANLALPSLFKGTPARRILRTIDRQPGAKVVFLGNSLVEAGIDGALWNRENPDFEGLSLGIGSTWAPEHYLLYRERVRRHGIPGTLVVGFFFLGLSENAEGAIAGNRSVAFHLVEPKTIGLYAKDPPARWRFEWTRRVPFLVYRDNLWARVERARRWVGELGFASARTNAMGRTEDFEQLAETDTMAFARDCANATGKPLNPAMERLLADAIPHGVRVIFVSMPQPASTRMRQYATLEWRHYRNWLESELKGRGARFIDAAAWVPDDSQFADSIHLNARGAATFTRRLANEVAPGRRTRSPDGT